MTKTRDLADLGGGFIQVGTGAVQRTVESKLQDVVSVLDFIPPGTNTATVNCAPYFQSAITAATNVVVPPGTYAINTQLTSTGNLHLLVQGTIKPTVNAGSTQSILKITGGNCTITFEGSGGIDCTSSSYSNWSGIEVTPTSGMVENIHITGGLFQNIGINNNQSTVIAINAVRSGSIKNTTIKNCGVISNVVGGGFGIYTANCEGFVVDSNNLDTVGSSAINMSCGLNNIVSNNKVSKATLFAFKGGYGIGAAVTSNISPTTTQFSVADTVDNRNTLKVGQAFYIPRVSVFPSPQGVIKSIVDNGSYLTITTQQSMGVAPIAGETMQPLDTNCVWDSNSLTYSGDNGFDQNGVYNITVTNNRLMYSGWYQDVGTFGGFGDGVWIGYDPQGSLNTMINTGVLVSNNIIQHTFGSAIEIFTSNNVTVNDNILFQYNEGKEPGTATPAYGGVSVGRLGYYRTNQVVIANNSCKSTEGFGVYCGFSTQNTITHNNISSPVGITANAVVAAYILSNVVTVNKDLGYGLLVSDGSGSNPCSGVLIKGNYITQNGSTGACVRISDAGASVVKIDTDNTLSGGAGVNRIEDLSSSSSALTPVSDGYAGAIFSSPLRIKLDPGQSYTLAQYFSDAGTIGGARVFGFMRSGTGAFEYFETVYYGNVSMRTIAFTSKGSPNGTAFLASGDFTTTTSGSKINCVYTNNEANQINAILYVESFSRF
jgi:hypothetical protein